MPRAWVFTMGISRQRWKTGLILRGTVTFKRLHFTAATLIWWLLRPIVLSQRSARFGSMTSRVVGVLWGGAILSGLAFNLLLMLKLV